MSERQVTTNIPVMDLPDNKIRTSKYNWYSFIPKNLMEQYSKLANIYFTFIGIDNIN